MGHFAEIELILALDITDFFYFFTVCSLCFLKFSVKEKMFPVYRVGDKKSLSFGFFHLKNWFFSLKFNFFRYRFCYRFKKQSKDREFFLFFIIYLEFKLNYKKVRILRFKHFFKGFSEDMLTSIWNLFHSSIALMCAHLV